ncbi:hypothetical protein B0H17DRAFT_1121482 [Mycena rosella]|uniref:Uncharacterized protein n=1 Tax=Mycena rosella TaxID=1033263 RepID=A0AAD7AXU6_MYCRO|nr:hypothetical protein B0H17DRAFT_1121482 [Mycena rosella]
MREDYGEIGNKLCYRLAEAIQMLPSSSPLLHTLHLNLEIPLNNVGDCPWSGHHDLIADINQIHLPALVTLDLSVNLDSTDEEFVDPNFPTTTNFFPFLNSHPHLLHLTLDVPGTKLENDLTFLPCLRSFTGSFKDAAIICDHPRQLDELVLKLVQRHTYDFPEFRTLPLRTHLSLTKLHVQALDADGKVVKMTNELSPTSLAQLVSSFPNLTHLDICIHGRIPQYRESLILLTKLQSLRIQLYKINQEDPYDSYMWDDLDNIPDPNAPVHKIFPPSDYIRQFDDVVPSLPQLAHIEIFLLADNVELYDDDCEMLFEPPQMRGTYYFCVRGGKVVLERATSTRKRRKTVGVVRR